MPKLQQSAKATATATTTTEVKLSPTVRRKLLTNLKAYADLKTERDALDVAMDGHKAAIRTLRESTGEEVLALDGFRIKNVTGTHKKLNQKKLVELGCAMAWIQEATEEKPKRAYELITLPGEKDASYEGDR